MHRLPGGQRLGARVDAGRGAGRPLLLRAVPTTGQGGQGARQRRTRRIRLASPVPRELRRPGAPVVIVDDVVTTLAERPGRQHVIITGRRADPKIIEIADLVTFLCSSRAGNITGSDFVIDGKMSAWLNSLSSL